MERLLAGHADTGDDGLAPLAGLFTTLRTPGQAAEPAGTDDLVARMTKQCGTAERNPYLPPGEELCLPKY